jgi:hypothetical protein
MFLLVALVLAPACKRKTVKVGTDEETPRMRSVLVLADPKTEPQLIKGFHGIEAGAWRWTEKSFTVALRPPFGAAQKGAKLSVKLTVPEPTIQRLQSISLSANVAGTTLAPETYTTAGDYMYVRDVPAELLGGDTVRVDFQLDKAIPPGGGDIRELGIIVFSIGLEANK